MSTAIISSRIRRRSIGEPAEEGIQKHLSKRPASFVQSDDCRKKPETAQTQKLPSVSQYNVEKVNKWLTEPIPAEMLEKVLACVVKLTEMLGFSDCDMRLPVLVYSQRFISEQGPIPKEKLFYLFAVTTCVALKFLEEEGRRWVDQKMAAELLGLPAKTLARLEFEFLSKVKYTLMLREQDVEPFTPKVTVVETSPAPAEPESTLSSPVLLQTPPQTPSVSPVANTSTEMDCSD